MHIKRFKNQKFSYPGEGDTPSPGSHPSCLVPQRKNSALWALQVPTQMEICTFIDLAEFIREMAENNHTFGGSPILIYGHPGFTSWMDDMNDKKWTYNILAPNILYEKKCWQHTGVCIP